MAHCPINDDSKHGRHSRVQVALVILIHKKQVAATSANGLAGRRRSGDIRSGASGKGTYLNFPVRDHQIAQPPSHQHRKDRKHIGGTFDVSFSSPCTIEVSFHEHVINMVRRATINPCSSTPGDSW